MVISAVDVDMKEEWSSRALYYRRLRIVFTFNRGILYGGLVRATKKRKTVVSVETSQVINKGGASGEDWEVFAEVMTGIFGKRTQASFKWGKKLGKKKKEMVERMLRRQQVPPG